MQESKKGHAENNTISNVLVLQTNANFLSYSFLNKIIHQNIAFQLTLPHPGNEEQEDVNPRAFLSQCSLFHRFLGG